VPVTDITVCILTALALAHHQLARKEEHHGVSKNAKGSKANVAAKAA